MNIDALRQLLIRHEGNSLRLYYLNGIPHLGVGINLRDRGITERQSLLLLDDDITDIVTRLTAALPWFAALDDVRQRALIDLAYNVGVQGALAFRHLLAACVAQDWETAAREVLDSDAARLLPTRYAELAQMIRTGRDRGPVE